MQSLVITVQSPKHAITIHGSHTRTAPHAPGRPSSTCPSDGFSPPASSCMCNFAGACDISTGVPTSAAASFPRTLDGFAPQNVEAFAYDKGGATSVDTICEKALWQCCTIVTVEYRCTLPQCLMELKQEVCPANNETFSLYYA